MIRVGIGYDIHPFREGRGLILGGVNIPHAQGLAGHSDADVLIHALIDAMLGATALGDIGSHFPPSDEQYAGASSLDLLDSVAGIMAGAGWRLVNADAVIVAEEPRLGPHIPAMRAAIAGRLGLSEAAIAVKATTNERLGPEGRGEGISAHCVCLVESTHDN